MLPEEYPMSILRQSPEFAKTVAATSVATLVEVIPPEMVSTGSLEAVEGDCRSNEL